jgi:hypothetical protein
MNRRPSAFFRIVFVFVIVFLAGVVSVTVRAVSHSQSDRIMGITFFVSVVCLVLFFEKVFPSVYPGLRRSIPWWQTRAGFAVAFVIIGIMISILFSPIATIWLGLTVVAGALVALLLRASRRAGEL